jgi:hypothetical protein
MFMKIDAGNNTHIVINLGQDISQANDLVKMFEQNAKFVNCGYGATGLNKPVITVELGNSVEFAGRYDAEEKVLIQAEPNAPVGFVVATNEAFIDVKGLKEKHQEAMNKKAQENKQLQAQIEVLKGRIDVLESPQTVEDPEFI